MEEKRVGKIIDICLKHEVLIVSDEIHADVVYEEKHHILAAFPQAKEYCII